MRERLFFVGAIIALAMLGAGSARAARYPDSFSCGSSAYGYVPNQHFIFGTPIGSTTPQWYDSQYDHMICAAFAPGARTGDGYDYGTASSWVNVAAFKAGQVQPYAALFPIVSPDPYYYIGLDSNASELEVELLSSRAYRAEVIPGGSGSSCDPRFQYCGVPGLSGSKGGDTQVKIYYPATTTARLVNAETGEVYYSQTYNGNPPRFDLGCYFGHWGYPCYNQSAPQQTVLTKAQKPNFYQTVLKYEVIPSGPWTLALDCTYGTGLLGNTTSGSGCPDPTVTPNNFNGPPGPNAWIASSCTNFSGVLQCTASNKVYVDGGMVVNMYKGPLRGANQPTPPPPPPPTITLANPTTGCSTSNSPFVTLSWTSSTPLKAGTTVYRDGKAIGSVGTSATYTDNSPLAGNHQYFISGADSSYTVIKSAPKGITTATGCTPPGITVQISGPADGLKRNSQYQYAAQVTNSVTGQAIQLDPGSSGSTNNISINFDDRGQGRINSNYYESNGRELLIESGINGTGPSNDIPGDGAYLFQSNSAACPNFQSISTPNYLAANVQGASPASWAPLKLKFSSRHVVDSATFVLVLAGTETVEVRAVDTNGSPIGSPQTFIGSGSGVCAGQTYSVSLSKGTTTGIAEIQMRRTDADIHAEQYRTNGFGIDNLSYSQPHAPTPSATIRWSLVNNRIGLRAQSFSPIRPVNGTPTTLYTDADCSIGTATDAIAATVTAFINGQPYTGTASLPLSMQDPCATSTGSPPNAADDQASTSVGTAATVPVLANDSDPDGDLDTSSLSIASQPASGAGTVTKSGTQLVYNPGSYTGPSAMFTYSVCDYGHRCSTASVQMTILPVPTGISYSWSVSRSDDTHKEFGDLDTASASSNPTKFLPGENCALLNAFGGVTLKLHVDATLSGQPVSADASKPLSAAGLCGGKVVGDIFGLGGVSGISVGRNSVVSSSGQVKVTRNENTSAYDIPDYRLQDASALAWGQVQAQIESTASRLKIERARTLSLPGGTITGTFNLNPKNGDYHDGANNDGNPDGGVWYVSGNLTIADGAQFKGRGTIIVQGRVTVAGSMSYLDKGNLGVIVLGGDDAASGGQKAVTIKNGATQGSSVVGAFAAPRGTIDFQANVDRATGLFVGSTLQFNPALTNLAIEYDNQITTSPPPGFAQSFVPSLGEAAP